MFLQIVDGIRFILHKGIGLPLFNLHEGCRNGLEDDDFRVLAVFRYVLMRSCPFFDGDFLTFQLIDRRKVFILADDELQA